MPTATPERIDERGARYAVDVEDNAATLVELASGAIGTILSSWATRVRRDDLLTFQIDGTKRLGHRRPAPLLDQTNAQTPRTAHFSIAIDLGIDYRAGWRRSPTPGRTKIPIASAGRISCAMSSTGAPMQADFAAGIRDVQFAEACYRSIKEEHGSSSHALS